MTQAVNLAAVRSARASLARLAEDFPVLRVPSSRSNRQRWEEVLEGIMATRKKNETAEQDGQLVVRLPKALLQKVDEYAERLRVEQPGPAWKRSDVVRLLLARALDAAEPRRGRGGR